MSEPSSLLLDSTSPRVSSDDALPGLSLKELVHAIVVTHLAFLPSPTISASRLPQPTRLPLARSHGFHHASGTTRLSDHSPSFASHFAFAYRVTYPGATREPGEFSWGHAQLFRTVPSANTLVRWVNENAFAPIVRARPCPTFGRPVHLQDSSLDYGPVLLLMPFGFHLAMDTLPSGERRESGSRSALAVSGFRLRARLGFSIPAFPLRPARHYPRLRI